MKREKKPLTKLRLLAMIWGIIVSSILLLTIGLQIIFGFYEEGPGTMQISLESFIRWDDPGPFFVFYMTGYAVIWWKKLWGSFIIMATSILFPIIAGPGGPLMFAIPGFIVGALYVACWYFERRNKQEMPGNSL
jgi:hypothetical protein